MFIATYYPKIRVDNKSTSHLFPEHYSLTIWGHPGAALY